MIFVQISKCICLNFKMHFSLNFKMIFIQIIKWNCAKYKMHLSECRKIFNRFTKWICTNYKNYIFLSGKICLFKFQNVCDQIKECRCPN